MANNIGYKASIDAEWVSFKEQSGVEISDNGKTLETRDVIPSNLKLIVKENTGVTREATITFTQEGGEQKTVTLRQNKSNAGRYPDGKSYFNKSKSSLVIENKSGITDLDISGGTVNFTATYNKVYSTNWYETDYDGNVTSGWVEDNTTSRDVTSVCRWTVSPAINDSKINKGELFAELFVGENKSNGSPTYNVNATYIDSGNTFTSNTLKVNQKPAPVAWIFTVKTNNPDTIVYFLLSGDTEVKVVQHEEAKLKDDELKDDAYYSTYSTSGVESPNISAYIVKDDVYTTPKINLYEKGTETELKDKQWNASSSGGSMELDAVYEVSKTTYKVDNDSANTKTLVDGETFEINSNEDKTENIKRHPSGETDSSWLSIKPEGDANNDEDFTYSISAENNTSDSVRKGVINFKYSDDKLPPAETLFNVIQQYKKFVVTPSAITVNWDETSYSGVTISSTESD